MQFAHRCGEFLFSDSTKQIIYAVVCRLLRYDELHNSTEILIDNLHFANGVQLSKYEDFLLVSETARARILKYEA